MIGQSDRGAASRGAPTIFDPVVFVAGIGLALLGAVIGLELLTRVGVSPNTSIVGAMLAMALARVPLASLQPFRDIRCQNLLQTVISSATFGGANAIFLPLGVAWLVGRDDLLPAMFIGAVIGMTIDGCLMYWLFDSPIFPGSGAWPPGVATAECLVAGDQGGTRASWLGAGAATGAVGQWFGIPMDVVGICWIGNVWALTMFGVGLLIRAYAQPALHLDLEAANAPHGVMIGAGLVALVQIGHELNETSVTGSHSRARSTIRTVRGRLGLGFLLYVAGAVVMSLAGGIQASMSPFALAAFVLFAACAALVSELIVGIAAMHAGWFPAFASALVFLVLGIAFGFPTVPLALLTGYTASTGPAFADLGYDFKTGWLLRGSGIDPRTERAGRQQQFFAALLGFTVAAGFVLLVHRQYLVHDRLPPADRVYAATIAAGIDAAVLRRLLLWAVPGAIVQSVGGASRQTGILLATGLLIHNAAAGWAAMFALAVRVAVQRRFSAREEMTIVAGGLIAGSALTGFGSAALRGR
jgi:uncharacterized oligopeptide transporter (OPT) family protein